MRCQMLRRWWLQVASVGLLPSPKAETETQAIVAALIAIARDYQRLVVYGPKYYRAQRAIEAAEGMIGQHTKNAQ